MALVVVMAVVAIAIPTCQMVGCDMGAMPFMPHGSGAGFFPGCDGVYVTTTGPAAVLPNGAESLLLTLVAAVVAAVVLFSPKLVARPLFIAVGEPPPPPDEPRGERFRV